MSLQRRDADVNFIGAVRYDATNAQKRRYDTCAGEYDLRGLVMERQILKMASGMNTNELTMRSTGACFFNFRQLQKSNETELVKCVSVQAFYQFSGCKGNLTPRQVENIIVSVLFTTCKPYFKVLHECAEQRKCRIQIIIIFVLVISVYWLSFSNVYYSNDELMKGYKKRLVYR